MEAIAKVRHLKGSPRKARLVIDLIRGRNVSQALAILKFTDKRAADPIAKTLRSAIANATFMAEQQNIAVDPDDLFVKTCFVDMGAHKNRSRMRPAPQGRAFREHRHYCHITIMVSSDLPQAGDDEKSKRKANLAAGRKTSGGERKSKTSVKGTAKAEGAVEDKKTKKSAKADYITDTKTLAEGETLTAESTGAGQIVETAAPSEITNPAKAFEEVNREATAEASDVKDVQSQTPAERHETKPVDEVLLDKRDGIGSDSGQRGDR
jgi:large subunit ribosomal protein L22